MDRQRPAGLVAGDRPDGPGGHARGGPHPLRHAVVGEDDRPGEGRRQAPPGGLAVQPVHARRAGRADLHRQDRADRARPRLEVLRRHAGDRRGPPRGGLQPLPPREDPAGLPAQPEPREPAAGRHRRQPLGHDLPRHAGAHRGPGAGGLRPHPQHGQRAPRQGRQRLRDAGRGPPRDVRPAGAARLLPPAHPGRARRAGGVLRRGLLPHAGPVPRRGGVGAPRAAQGGHRVRRALPADAAVPRLPVHAHRADPEGHRPVGAQDPERLHRDGRHPVRRDGHRRRDGQRRGRRRRARRPPHGPHPRGRGDRPATAVRHRWCRTVATR